MRFLLCRRSKKEGRGGRKKTLQKQGRARKAMLTGKVRKQTDRQTDSMGVVLVSGGEGVVSPLGDLQLQHEQ